jgi:hypothetical protein
MAALCWNISCLYMNLFCKLKEGCGCQTDKVGRQFSGSTAFKKHTFSRSVALLATWRLLRWRHSADKRHSSTSNNNMTLRYWLASLWQSMPHTWHNILLAEEVSQCPLASSRWDILVDRAGVRPLAGCSIMMHRLVTFSHDTMKLFRIVRSSKWENILSCKGLNPCSVNYNILPRRGQWALASLLSQCNIGKNQSIMTKYMKSAELVCAFSGVSWIIIKRRG